MKKKFLFKRTAAVCMAVSLCAGMAGCEKAPDQEGGKKEETDGSYQVTEENENLELTMNDQPESSYWFPQQLLEWEPEEDPDLAYNISRVPLAERMDREELTPVNKTQNKDTEVMAISIMNSSTSGNAPRGLNKVDCNTFTYWQYVDKLVYWGGSSGEGLIVPPSPDVTYTTIAKANAETSLDAVLTFDDGTEETISGDKKVGEDWTTVTYDISDFAGKKIRSISYRVSVAEDKKGYEINFGNISIYGRDDVTVGTVSNVTVDGSEFDEDAMYAGVRLSWETEGDAAYYEVYRINEDKTKSFLGVTNVNNFYINTLPRTDETNQSTFEVVPVDLLTRQGEGDSVTMEWPDNSLPKAGMKASRTLIAPGEAVTFESTCSENTEEVTWVLEGAGEETASGESVTASYEAEGTYNVTVKAKNASGEAERTYEGCIQVTSQLAPGAELTLLSGQKAAEASAYVNENEAPQFAVDGDVTKKWCATGTPPHELTIDLGEIHTVSQVAISHAEAGGEGADMNTKAYTISVSEDGSEYKEVTNVTRNTSGTTLDTFAPVSARYVKLSVVKPTQGSDTAARIYEVEVYGI